MSALGLFRAASVIVAGLFVWFGMDIRRKPGSHDLVAPAWQMLTKVAASALVAACGWVVLAIPAPGAVDWLALAVMTAGTGFIVAAKRALGATHTFTGQYRENPRLVTDGVYALTRNPLYLGVLLCEVGALLCATRHVPELYPRGYPAWFGLTGAALAYVVTFNWTMAAREAHELERRLGERYREYGARVPFVIPFTK